MTDVTMIDLKLVDPHPNNPRDDLGDLDVLAESIAVLGVLQPVIVRDHPLVDGRYQLEAGHRRTAAARQAGLSEIPAIVLNDDDERSRLVLIAENRQRLNLTPAEEARGLQGILTLGDLKTAARAVGVDPKLAAKAAKAKAELGTEGSIAQATFEELATIQQLGTDADTRAHLEALIGTPRFEAEASMIRTAKAKTKRIETRVAELSVLGAEPLENGTPAVALDDLRTEDGAPVALEYVPSDGMRYRINNYQGEVIVYVTREAIEAKGWICRYDPTPEELERREQHRLELERVQAEAAEARVARDAFIAEVAGTLKTKVPAAIGKIAAALEATVGIEPTDGRPPLGRLVVAVLMMIEDEVATYTHELRGWNAEARIQATLTYYETLEALGYTPTDYERGIIDTAAAEVAEDDAE